MANVRNIGSSVNYKEADFFYADSEGDGHSVPSQYYESNHLTFETGSVYFVVGQVLLQESGEIEVRIFERCNLSGNLG